MGSKVKKQVEEVAKVPRKAPKWSRATRQKQRFRKLNKEPSKWVYFLNYVDDLVKPLYFVSFPFLILLFCTQTRRDHTVQSPFFFQDPDTQNREFFVFFSTFVVIFLPLLHLYRPMEKKIATFTPRTSTLRGASASVLRSSPQTSSKNISPICWSRCKFY